VKVRVELRLVELTLGWENCTEIPDGSEPVARATLEVNPLPGFNVMVDVADEPGTVEMLAGDGLIVNATTTAAAATVTEIFVVFVTLPLVPLTVIEYVPGPTELLAAIDRVLVPEPGAAIVAGVNPTVTPLGVVADSAMAPLKPPVIVLINVTGALAPAWTLTLLEFVDSVNGWTTVRPTFELDVSPPPLAVTVIVDELGSAEGLAVIVNRLDPDPGAERFGEVSVAVTPAGTPLSESVTALLKPPATVTVAFDEALVPCKIVNDPADIVMFIDGVRLTAPSVQKLTRSLAFTEPSPVTRS
jgi:hypothetical protein